MRKIGWLLLVLAASWLPAHEKKEQPPPPLKIKAGQIAPDFTLQYFDGAKVNKLTLSEFRGKKNVVLAFYVFAFTPG